MDPEAAASPVDQLMEAVHPAMSEGRTSVAGRAERPAPAIRVRGALWTYVLAVGALGCLALVGAVFSVLHAPLNLWVVALAVLTLASGQYKIKVPGHPATVSVSEIFVFTSVLLFGPGPATLTVAIDGLWISLRQKNFRAHRAIFNVTEPAISTWVAGSVFFALAHTSPLALAPRGGTAIVAAGVAMSATYFLINSFLTAIAVTLENGGSAFLFWKRHALYLAMNYYAAGSLATLAIDGASGVNLGVVGLIAPLLALSYVAYKTAASRIEDAHEHIRAVEHLYQAAVETLAIAVDAKDQVTHGHIRRVQRHTVALASALGVHDEVELRALEAASLLHDVGKLAVPDYVLNKPGALSAAEFELIKVHPAKGAEILTAVEFPYPVVPVVRHHHEQWNGKGYPDGLAGEEIPIGARVLTVVDCFDALTSDRPYRRKMTDEDAIKILKARSGNMYDPRVVDAFIEMIPVLRRADRALETADKPSSQAVACAPAPVEARSNAGSGEAMGRSSALALVSAPLVEKLKRAMPDVEACVFSADPNVPFLVPAHATSAMWDAVEPLTFRVGDGLSGWVAANRYTIVNSDPDLDLGDAASQLGVRACTSTPVFAFGNLIGVVSVYLPRTRGFSDTDVRTVGTLAQDIGLEVTRYEAQLAEIRKARQPGPRAVAVC